MHWELQRVHDGWDVAIGDLAGWLVSPAQRIASGRWRKLRLVTAILLEPTAQGLASRNGVLSPSGSRWSGAFGDKSCWDLKLGAIGPPQLLDLARERQGHLLKARFGELLVLGAQAVLVPTSVVRCHGPR